jgi:hypothetical protein
MNENLTPLLIISDKFEFLLQFKEIISLNISCNTNNGNNENLDISFNENSVILTCNLLADLNKKFGI